MDKKVDINLEVMKEDIAHVKEFLKGKFHPVEFEDVVFQVAVFKTRETRKNQIKIYHPDCEYKVGDFIYKEYPGPIPVGSKKYIDFSGGVILKVEAVRSHFGMNQVMLSYEGTSEFRKYTEFLKKQKIDLLLPHKQQKPVREPEYLPVEQDPRSEQPPLIERDFVLLRRKLASALNKESEIAFISNKVMLKANQKEITAEVVDKIKEFLKGSTASESTEFFVENFARVSPNHADFDAYCFSLNNVLTNDYKIDLVQTSNRGWGKWHLISVLYYLKKNSLICEPNPLLSTQSFANRKNLVQKRKVIDEAVFSEGENRYYLTAREIASGALRLKPGLYDFGDAVEITAVDANTRKEHVLYYYKDENLLLGFGKVFEHYKALQGMIVHFEQLPDKTFHFSIKTTKKGMVADKIVYDAEKRGFHVTEEKFSTAVPVNKFIFLENDVLHILEAHLEEFRKQETINKLIHKVFLEFGLKEKNYEIHILRLYHILDLIYPIDFRLVEEIILSNIEFIPSEKVHGVFYLDSDAVVEIEEEEKKRRQRIIEENKRKREEMRQKQQDEENRQKEELRRKREENRRKREDEMWERERMKGDGTGEDGQVVDETVAELPPVAAPTPAAAAAVPAGDEEAKADLLRKGKKKSEVEKPAKSARKGMKRIVEERIELDEIKKEILQEEFKEELGDKDDKKKEPARETKVAYTDEGGFGGIFASKLEKIVKKEDNEEQ